MRSPHPNECSRPARSLPSHQISHTETSHHSWLFRTVLLPKISEFVLHDEGLWDYFVQFILVAKLVVKIHYLFFTVVFVYWPYWIDLADGGEIAQAHIFYVLRSYSPVLTLDLAIDIAAELGVLSSLVGVQQVACFQNQHLAFIQDSPLFQGKVKSELFL